LPKATTLTHIFPMEVENKLFSSFPSSVQLRIYQYLSHFKITKNHSFDELQVNCRQAERVKAFPTKDALKNKSRYIIHQGILFFGGFIWGKRKHISNECCGSTVYWYILYIEQIDGCDEGSM